MFKQFRKYPGQDAVDFSIHHFTLSFKDKNHEKQFSRAYFQNNLQYGRILHLVAIFFYVVMGFWDALITDASRLNIWTAVTAVVVAIFLAGLGFSYLARSYYAKYWQQIFAFYVLMTGVGFTVVTAASAPNYTPHNFVGIIICLLFGYTFIRLTFIWAALAGNAIVIAYTLAVAVFVAPSIKVLATNFFYLFGIDLLGMMICYSQELIARRDFVLNFLLQRAEDRTQKMNENLEWMVQERTKALDATNQKLETAIQREKELVDKLKKEEERLQKSLKSLEQAEAIAKLGYFERNWQNGEGYWSKGFYQLLGLDYNTKAVSHEAFMAFIHDDDRERVKTHIQQSLRDIQPMDIEFRLIKNNGAVLQIHGVADTLTNDEGEPVITRGTFQDITEQKKIEKEKVKLENQLQQAYKMEAIGTLAGGIAHDFNNILSAIIGFTELSLDDVEQGSPLEDNLREIYTAGERARDLVRQILAYARQSNEETMPIQLNAVVKEVLKFIRSSVPTTIDIQQRIDSDSLIMANQTQVHQIMMNLCTNAAHAMEETGGVLEVLLKDICVEKNNAMHWPGLKAGDYILLQVADTGPGISSKIIDSIFEPYFTTKELGKGTGMGLAMVQGIVETYGGKIYVQSQVGQGASFKVLLPVTRKRRINHFYTPQDLPTGTEHILFVDDEAPIAEMGRQVLERLGYTVTTRTSSLEALALFKSKINTFDLVVTDMTMPNMTGDELTKELMKVRDGFPVVLCTGYSNKISDAIARQIGVKAFAYKPIVKAELAKTVRKVLDDAKDES